MQSAAAANTCRALDWQLYEPKVRMQCWLNFAIRTDSKLLKITFSNIARQRKNLGKISWFHGDFSLAWLLASLIWLGCFFFWCFFQSLDLNIRTILMDERIIANCFKWQVRNWSKKLLRPNFFGLSLRADNPIFKLSFVK